MTVDPPQDEEVRRLHWQCRRGMLELDVALQRFLDEDYPRLDAAARAAFARMLAAEDQTLHAWLMGRAVPEEADIRSVVALIRAFGRGPG